MESATQQRSPCILKNEKNNWKQVIFAPWNPVLGKPENVKTPHPHTKIGKNSKSPEIDKNKLKVVGKPLGRFVKALQCELSENLTSGAQKRHFRRFCRPRGGRLMYRLLQGPRPPAPKSTPGSLLWSFKWFCDQCGCVCGRGFGGGIPRKNEDAEYTFLGHILPLRWLGVCKLFSWWQNH